MSASRQVLVLNAGSSSLKFQLFNAARDALTAVVHGNVQRIGDEERSNMKANILEGPGKGSTQLQRPVKDHTGALDVVLRYLQDSYSRELKQHIEAVGHRVVHGRFAASAKLVTDKVLGLNSKDTRPAQMKVMQEIQDAAELAPLHNPPNLQGIQAAMQLFPSCPQVAVYDTAFHQTMPPEAYTYALPWKMAEEKGIRRYGAHGTSYQYLLQQTAKLLGKPATQVNMIACHIGAGASMCAIKRGACIDTSMGMTPLEGLVMGTRSGDLDPSVVLFLQQAYGLSASDCDRLLNKQSGLLGLCGQSDFRNVLQQAKEGDEQADLALKVFVHRIRKYLGAYLLHFNGELDAVVFSAGVGENSPAMRSLVCERLEAFGIQVDPKRNEQLVGRAGDFAAAGAPVRLLTIPTDEELSIAQQTLEVLQRQ